MALIPIVLLPALRKAEGAEPGPPAVPLSPGVPTAGRDGQLSTRFRIDRNNPEQSVPSEAEKNENPIEFGYFLQDLLAEAELAHQRKDWSAMVGYYRAVAKAVPDQARGWSKLCGAYKLANDPARAARACKYATERPGAELDDFTRYVSLTLQKPEPLTAGEDADLRKVLAHLEAQPQAAELDLTLNQLRCQLGVKASDASLLEQCTAALARSAPNDLKTVVYQWSLAAQKGERARAARFLSKAQDLGLSEGNIQRMRKLTPGGGAGSPLLWLAVAGLLVLGAGTAVVLALWQRRVRTRAMVNPVAP